MANKLKWVDDRVPKDTTTCPVPGSIHWGHIRKPIRGDTSLEPGGSDTYANYIADYSYDETVEDCASFAMTLLAFTNDLVKKEKTSGWDADVATRWSVGRLVRKALVNDDKADLQRVYWSFTNTPENADFGATCRVYWNCAGTELEAKTDAVSGVVEAEDLGMRTACVIPRYTKDCLLNPIKGGRPELCTPLAMEKGKASNECWKWYDSLSAGGDGSVQTGDTNRTAIVNEICGNNPWLAECACMSRGDREYGDPVYAKANQYLSSTTDVCWWQACKLEGADRRITPQMEARRYTECNADFCGNFVTAIDSTDLKFLAELNQNVNCTTDNSNSNAPPVPVGTDIPLSADGAQKFLSDAINSVDSGNVLMFALLGGGLFILLAGLAIVYYFFVRKSDTSEKEEPTKKKTKAKK
jgi:hypothetical protein